MLNAAEKGIYNKSAIKSIPLHYIHQYFMRGERSQNGFYRIAPKLRSCVKVKYFNLMESFSTIQAKMDFIFCRNVMIYFNRETRQVLTDKFYNQLKSGGYLFVGSSETLNGLDTEFNQAGPTIYHKI
jgi:chemotaxis protein methyltransferase CheR